MGGKIKNLKELLKEEGRTQEWLRLELEKLGTKRTFTQIHRWCVAKSSPNNVKIINQISDILQYEESDIAGLFDKTYEL